MSSNFSEISSFIWNVCDDVLRGLFKQHEYGDVILPFTVLRRLDCVLEPHKDDVFNIYEEYRTKVDEPTPIILKRINTTFFNHSKYDLNRLKSDPQNIYMNFQNYLGGFSSNVVEIIENFQLEKPVEKLNKNNRLFILIDKFTEIDLHPDKISNRDMGLIFEELLRKFSEMSNETSGEHYTPRDVVRLLVSLVFTEDKDDLQGEGKVRSIFDPCCGTGGMLTIGKEYVHQNINDMVKLRLLGQELNPQTYSICKSDMLIIGEDPDNIRLGSSLSEDNFQGNRFDYMITNPPFGVSWKSEKEFVENEKQNPDGRFTVGTPRTSDGSLLFLQHIIPNDVPEMTINPQLVVLKNIQVFPKYLYYQTTCRFIKESFDIEQTGSTTPTISQEKINEFPIIEPPVSEQKQIVDYLDEQTQKIDSTIEKETKRIELLKEYRQSLISDVVTGKIDVRDYVIENSLEVHHE